MQLRFADADSPRPILPADGDAGVHSWRTDAGTLIASGCQHDGSHWMSWPGLATFRFRANDSYVTAFPDPAISPHLVNSIFSRSVLPMVLQTLGHEALHASAVVHPTKGVIVFAARAHVGKSTLAFGLVASNPSASPSPNPTARTGGRGGGSLGLRQWADDGVVWRVEWAGAMAGATPVPVAMPLPFKPRLRAPAVEMIKGQMGQRRPGHEGREGLEGPGGQVGRVGLEGRNTPTRIGTICLLERADGTLPWQTAAALTRLRQAEAFSSVLAHAQEFDPFNADRRAAMLRAYLELVAQVPVYRLQFRAGSAHFDRVLDTIVRELELQAVSAGLCAPL